MPWRSAEAFLGSADEEDVPQDDELEELPPGAIVVHFPDRPLVLKRPTRLHDDRGAIWRPEGENAATFGPMPLSARLARPETTSGSQ